jgi:hypothetical protein
MVKAGFTELVIFSDMHDPTNTKDFVCELCGNAYARSTGLKQHMLSQHSEQVS